MNNGNSLRRPVLRGNSGVRDTVVFIGGKNLNLLTIERLVLEVTERLALSGARKTGSATNNGGAHLLLDLERFENALRAILCRAIPEGTATVCGTRLPIALKGTSCHGGCALISISFRETRRAPFLTLLEKTEGDSSADGILDLEQIVADHGGTLSIARHGQEVMLNIYLPVIRSSQENSSPAQEASRIAVTG
jgi:hypothetical protein